MNTKKVDFLVIGSGVSGLYLAYLLSELGEVLIVTKDQAFKSNTYYAQGGIASVLKSTDSFESHIEDTLKAGAGLCNLEAVNILVREGPKHIHKLLQLGAEFVLNDTGSLDLRREGGHSQARVVHAADFTGREIERVLLAAVRSKANLHILEHHSVVELITHYHLETNSVDKQIKSSKKHPHCFGAYVYNRKSWEISIIQARATILATGGAGQVYLHSTNPSLSTGDGVALAYRAGAEIANMEFYQFHPTALYTNQKQEQVFLLTETLRGHGALLRDNKGKTFLERYDKRSELAPRDIVAQAIDTELKRSGTQHVWLDATHLSQSDLQKKFPNVYCHLKSKGIDMSQEWVPVVPAAHYMCGGVHTDLWGKTNIRHLYALGEVACSGVHGSNRLASNSLLEGLVFAWRITEDLKRNNNQLEEVALRKWQKEDLSNPQEWVMVQHNFEEIQKTMWDYVGILRSNERLERAQSRIHLLREEIEDYYRRTVVQNKILELRNLALTAHLIVQSAILRKESRGLHHNINYPNIDSPSSKYTILRRCE